jgi:hypothetical protein
LPLWGFLGRSIVFAIGFLLVIPAPWVAVWAYRWFFSRVHVPGRPNLAFEAGSATSGGSTSRWR